MKISNRQFASLLQSAPPAPALAAAPAREMFRPSGSCWRSAARLLAAVCLGGLACNVPEPSVSESGILPGQQTVAPLTPMDDAATDPASAGGAVECLRGWAVIQSDYESTNVALVSLSGDLLSPSLISSASASPALSAALSGDVVLPSQPVVNGELVLIDRYPAGVLTWVNLETAQVRAQLPVNQGFSANPHDVVTLSENKAYVTRFEGNAASGVQPYDAGDDVLIIDPSVPAITGRIDLSNLAVPPEFSARPDRAMRMDRWLYVVLGRTNADFSASLPSVVAVIDTTTDTLVGTQPLGGLHGCSGLVWGVEAQELAIACSGQWGPDGTPDLATSGVVRFGVDFASGALIERGRWLASELGQRPFGGGVAYASQDWLLATLAGSFPLGGAPAVTDQLVALQSSSGQSRPLLESNSEAYVFGDVRCDCGRCVLADAEEPSALRWFELAAEGPQAAPSPAFELQELGLPPRALGMF